MALDPTTTHTLAIVADAYNPLLLVFSLFACAVAYRASNILLTAQFVGIVVITYAMMFIDKFLLIWAHWGLDFSTHTATSLAMVLLLVRGKPWWAQSLLWASLVSYGFLMNILNYHSWADMLTTAIVITILIYTLFNWSKKFMLQQTDADLS